MNTGLFLKLCHLLVFVQFFSLIFLFPDSNHYILHHSVIAKTFERSGGIDCGRMVNYLLILVANILVVTAQPFPDWLVTTITTQTQLVPLGSGKFRLTNGLISRDFITTPDFATVDFFSHERKQSILRAVRLIVHILLLNSIVSLVEI